MADNKEKGLRVNEQIRVREVRLIDDEGEQKGIVPTTEALKMAKERELDLVEVAPTVAALGTETTPSLTVAALVLLEVQVKEPPAFEVAVNVSLFP